MTAVCLTIDLECSIGGAFAHPNRLPLSDEPIWCRIAGKSHGLGFILDTLARHRLVATFFIETNSQHYFDTNPMQLAVESIVAAGHDIQLHAHPCWSIFKHADWRSRCGVTGMDDFSGLSLENAIALLDEGIATFAEWGLPRPKVFRSGNLQHDRNLYLALASCGIPYSSSIGLGIFDSGQKQYQLSSGEHRIGDVLEIPITSFDDWSFGGSRRVKSLTIAGTTFSETRSLLFAAEQAALPSVVILTHPFEFINKRDVQYSIMQPNEAIQKRFDDLCAFLAGERNRFPVLPIVEVAASARTTNIGKNHTLHTTFGQSVYRKASNFLHATMSLS